MEHARILVIGHGFLGDALMTTPFLTRLLKRDPAPVTVLAPRPGLEVYRRLPGLAGIIDRGEPGLLARLRREAFTAAFVLKDDLGSALLAWRAGIPERTGFSREGARLFLTRARRPQPGEHGASRHFALLEETPPARPRAVFPFTPEESARAGQLLAGLRQPVVVMAPSTTRPEKNWPLDHCRALIKGLAGRGIATILVGGPADRERHEQLQPKEAAMPGTFRDLTGATTFGELAALLARTDLVVACDSGPMHLAAAVGAPLVALFGQTDPARSGPLDPAATILRATTTCAPCLSRHCGAAAACMASIDPATVKRAILDRLDQSAT